MADAAGAPRRASNLGSSSSSSSAAADAADTKTRKALASALVQLTDTTRVLEEHQHGAVEMLLRLLGNVAEHPDEPKYRSIKCTNPKVKAQLLDHHGADAFLLACGWHTAVEDMEKRWKLDVPADAEKLEQQMAVVGLALDALRRKKQETAEKVERAKKAADEKKYGNQRAWERTKQQISDDQKERETKFKYKPRM